MLVRPDSVLLAEGACGRRTRRRPGRSRQPRGHSNTRCPPPGNSPEHSDRKALLSEPRCSAPSQGR